MSALWTLLTHHAAFRVGECANPLPSRAQRAQLGIHLNRRQPSKEDYTNFALYQANQKAYEAAFLKNFVAHALHPDRVAECFSDSPENFTNVASYLKSVLQNVSSITDKMLWNAHCRAVNLLANDGKDGAPFYDVHTFDRRIFSDFCPDNPVLVVSRMNESWHRATSEPAMVRMSTKQYPIGSYSSPLEEIDEIAERVFNDETLVKALPTGRPMRPPAKKKSANRARFGATVREESQTSSRGTWLAFPSQAAPYHSPAPPAEAMSQSRASTYLDASNDVSMGDVDNEPRIYEDLRNAFPNNRNRCPDPKSSTGEFDCSSPSITQLENLFECFGADASRFDRRESSVGCSEEDEMTKVPSWHTRLLNDHKRRLTERWGTLPQTLRRALPGIKQVIAEALDRGYRPVDRGYRRKIKILEARENNHPAMSEENPQSSKVDISNREIRTQLQDFSSSSQCKQTSDQVKTKQKINKQRTDIFRKKQKTSDSSTSIKNTKKDLKASSEQEKNDPPKTKVNEPPYIIEARPLHPSGSMTLESHQVLPPQAYFERQTPNEKPAWRCGIKHAMGHYYNAGNRTACPGCFVNIKDSAKTKAMDFYLPTSTHFFQPAPDITYKPSKPLGKVRRSKTLSHNSIAKEAYWAAIDAGASSAEAQRAGVDAVEAALRPVTPKEPTPEPTPEPEPDLGPHPSGSETMEHGQDLPECAYFDKKDKHEEYAWRCDVNHALGRYYLAGDKRSCPGCGSARHGFGKQAIMDFYLSPGVVVRQDAPGLSQWKPRKPYKNRKASPQNIAAGVKKHYTHNQICSRRYFEAIEAGHEDEQAERLAIERLEAELEAKQYEAPEAHEHTRRSEEAENFDRQSSEDSDNSCDSASLIESVQNRYRRTPRVGCAVSLVPKKRNIMDLSDDEADDSDQYETPHIVEEPNDAMEVIESSSSGEGSSGSDSE